LELFWSYTYKNRICKGKFILKHYIHPPWLRHSIELFQLSSHKPFIDLTQVRYACQPSTNSTLPFKGGLQKHMQKCQQLDSSHTLNGYNINNSLLRWGCFNSHNFSFMSLRLLRKTIFLLNFSHLNF
jgi:hypothetical protein